MSNSNSTYAAFGVESTFGTAAATFYKINFTSLDIGSQVQKTADPTIRSDRNALAPITLNKPAGGSISGVLRYDITGAFWQLLRHTLQSTASTAATTQVTGVTLSSGNLAATGVHTGIAVGDIVRVLTSADVLAYWARVTSVGTNTIGTDIDTGASGSNLKVLRGTRLKNGSTQASYTCELGYTDIGKYEVLTGLTPGSFTLNISDQQLVTYSFGLTGKTTDSVGNAAIGGAYNDPPTTLAINCEDNVAAVRLNGDDYAVQSLTLAVNNNLRARTGPGTVGAQSIGSGEFTVTGSMAVYFADFTEYSKFLADTTSGLYFVLTDPAGNSLTFTVPTIGYESHQRPITGLNTDIIQTLTFKGVVTTEGSDSQTMRVLAFAHV